MQNKTILAARSFPNVAGKLLFSLALGSIVSAQAASPSIWDGGGSDSLWNNAANWGGNVPVAGTAYDLQFGGGNDLVPNNDFAPGSAFRHFTFNADAGAFNLSGNSVALNGNITNNSANLQTISLPFATSTAVRTVIPAAGDITFAGPISGNGGLLLAGTGSVTLGAKNTFTNSVTLNGAILNLPTGGEINNAGFIIVGNTVGQNAGLNITGGTITNSQAANTGNFMVGRSGFGSMHFTGGSVKVNQVYIGFTSGTGTALVDGGSFYCSGSSAQYVVIGNSTGTGVLTVKSGLFNHVGAVRTISLNNNGIGRAELNVLGGTLDNSGGGISYGYNTALQAIGTGSGIVNLNGGELLLNRFINAKQTIPTPGADNSFSYINFNGGTLTATPSTLNSPPLTFSSNFIPAAIEIYVNGPFGTNAGGAVINTAGEDCIVDSPLRAPIGLGITQLAITDGGSGYCGAPYVSISGGNGVATAIANMVDDGTGKGTLKVGSITVTSPGVNYDGGATFSLIGGAPTAAAIPGAVTTGIIASGGLVKNGAGTLTLNGANTYAGPTFVNAGKLFVTSAHSGGGNFTVADGATFGVIRDAGTTQMTAGNLTVGSATGAGINFVLPDGVPSEQVLNVGTLVLNGTTTIDVSGNNLTVGSQFPLIKYTTLVGNPGSITNGVLMPPDGTLAVLVHNAANSSFDLKITAIASNLKWNGTVNSGGIGIWDVGVTTNWLNSSIAPSIFLQGADVTFDDTAAGVTSISINGEVSPVAMTVDNNLKNYTVGGSGSLVGEMTLTKTGTGTMTLNTANRYSGATVVNGGTLAISGSLSNATGRVSVEGGTLTISGPVQTGTGEWSAGATDFSKGIINVNEGAAVEFSANFIVGSNVVGSGAINITGGGLTNYQASLASNFEIGHQGYGSMNMSGGRVKMNRFDVGGNSGQGVATISGGEVHAGQVGAADYVIVGGIASGTGVLTVKGGLLNHAGANRLISVNNNSDGRGELNLLGGEIDNSGGGVGYGYNAGTGTGTGIVNINGGKITLNRFVNTKQGGALQTGNAYLNLNGGILTASPSTLTTPNLSLSSNFIPARMDVYVNGPFGSFAGGAVIDTADQNPIVASPLRAPTGSGISLISVADGGSGYIGAPYVSIQGDGTGANAIANMISDGNGTLKVGSVTVVNPGVNFTDGASFYSFIGGGAAVPATPGAITVAANTSGGLTKNGAGTLTLAEANTYTGATVVNAGTLRVNGSLDASSAVTVVGGALAGNGSVGGVVNIQSGGTLAPAGALSINNTLTLATGSTTLMQVNANTAGSDLVQAATANYGGALVISNTAGTLTVGQTFQLFNASAKNGNFASVQTAGDGVTWVFDPANGIATVESIATVTPTNIVYTSTATTITLAWPDSHLGWYAQSNSVDVANPDAWVDIAGSELGTTLNINIDTAKTNVFYRLRQP